MNILENFKMALSSIKANKMRSFLTMLGIIIGISSVITIISLGQGGQKSITDEFEKMGVNNVNINVDIGAAGVSDYINLKDIEAVKEKVDSVKYVSPAVQKKGIASSESDSKAAYITGSNADYDDIYSYTMVAGRYFNESEVANVKPVVVVDETSAKALFGDTDVVGKSITVGTDYSSKKATIIGVREGVQMGPGMEFVFVDMPISFMETIDPYISKISSITVTSNSKEEVDEAAVNTISILENRHHNKGNDIYSSDKMIDKLSQINQVMSIFTSFIATVAAISLVVGGIGVMNIMLVSVTERTREIGVRKAIGATTKDILIQFLTESAIITLIGGIVGIILGYSVSMLGGSLMNITPVISPVAVFGVIVFSSAIGIFFGIYPAKKAANLNPIDALRYE